MKSKDKGHKGRGRVVVSVDAGAYAAWAVSKGYPATIKKARPEHVEEFAEHLATQAAAQQTAEKDRQRRTAPRTRRPATNPAATVVVPHDETLRRFHPERARLPIKWTEAWILLVLKAEPLMTLARLKELAAASSNDSARQRFERALPIAQGKTPRDRWGNLGA